jgi:hypothetical protein
MVAVVSFRTETVDQLHPIAQVPSLGLLCRESLDADDRTDSSQERTQQATDRTTRSSTDGRLTAHDEARVRIGFETATLDPMGSVRDTISGCWCLLSMAVATRFRMRGRYWSWRRETAFGSDRSRWPKAADRRRAIVEYARWAASMRRLVRRV